MTFQEFQVQLQRLKNCFGDRVYPEERSKLIWREVSSQSVKWLETTTDFFIGSRKLNEPPLPSDFATVMREEREREWQSGKGKRASEADAFWSSAPPGFFDKVFKTMKVESDE